MARCFLSALNVAEITKSKLMKSTVKLVTNIKLEMVESSEEFSEMISTLSKLTNTSSKILHKFIKTNLDKVLKIDPRANIMMSPHSHDDWALASDGEKIAFEYSQKDTDKARPKIKNTTLRNKELLGVFRQAGVANLSYALQVFENGANRYSGYGSRNGETKKGKIPKSFISVRDKGSFNFGRCDFLTIVWSNSGDVHTVRVKNPKSEGTKLKANPIEVKVRFSPAPDLEKKIKEFKDSFGVEVDKKTGEEITKFQANFSKKKNNSFVILLANYRKQLAYEPVGTLGVDLNLDKGQWITASAPIFGGSYHYPMPSHISKIIKEIDEVNSKINRSLEVSSKFRRIKGNVPHDNKNHSIESFGIVHKQRRRLRNRCVGENGLHAKLKDAIFQDRGVNLIKNYLIKNNLGLAMDMVQTGATTGTFGHDKVQEFFEMLLRTQGIPVKNTPAFFTSQRCSKCEHTEVKNRDYNAEEPQFECQKCGEVMNSGVNAAENIAQAALVMFEHDMYYFNKRKKDGRFGKDGIFRDTRNGNEIPYSIKYIQDLKERMSKRNPACKNTNQ